jgi:hypothetical protein
MRFKRWCASFLGGLALFGALGNSVAYGADRKILPGHVPSVVQKLPTNGRLAATNRLALAIGLPLRNQAGLNSFLREVYDPTSLNFHHYLTPEQFTTQFGPTEQDYAAVMDFAQTNGLAITHTHGNRVLLDVTGNVAVIERALHITLRTYRHPTEARDFYAPDTEPTVAASLPVLDISGLSDYGRPRSFLHRKPAGEQAGTAIGSAPGGAYMGKDFRTAYVPGTALNGFGQMVGLVELSGYDPNDIFAYEALAHLPDVPLQNVLLDGSVGDEVANGDAEAEACLDIEMAMAMATNLAAVVVFEAPYTSTTFNDVLNTMAASNQIKQFSSSWALPAGSNQTSDQIFQQMAAQGQSFFQASGDGDAWTSPIWVPADSPNVTVVGGTTLTTATRGASYVSEQVWNEGNLGATWGYNGRTNNYWGSGGGVSTSYAIPYWQTNVNMTTNLGSTTMRNIPDVALTANNIYLTHGSGTNSVVGGTSCAAPLWAGFMALVNQQAAELGQAPAGFINPAIYALGESTNYKAFFNDITVGSNTWSGSPDLYYAVPGYDLCTGWGTPAGTNLINALAGGAPDPLVISPLGGFIGNGAVGGPFNGTVQVFNLKNAGTGSLAWSLSNTSAWLSVSDWSGTLGAGGQSNVTVGLTSAASSLAAGTYTATVFYTNLTTLVAHPRLFTLRVGQSLVQDGGFESGSYCHWTLVGNTEKISALNPYVPYIYNGVESPHAAYNPVHSGNYGAFLGDSILAVLYQTLPTCPGQAYLLSFWLENPVGGSPVANHIEQFQVNWNTNATITNTLFSLPTQPNTPAFAWTNFNLVVTATGSNTTLQFGAENQPDYFGLDDVSVTAIPPPSFTALSRASNGLAFTWNTLANVNYRLQYTTNLAQPNWLNLGSVIVAATNSLTAVDTNAVNPSLPRFYRVAVSP